MLLAALFAAAPSHAEGTLDIVPKASEAAGAANAEKVRLYGASKALVIGINQYDAKAANGKRPWPQLSMAVKDAEEVAKALTEQGFKVTLLRDLASAELEAAFKRFFLVEGADPQARLLIWFAGHGHTIDGEGYLVPADAPGVRPDDIEFRSKAISLRRFGEYMREARAKHVLAIFDSCFAGTVFNVARAAPPPAITYSTGLPVRQFVSSGEAEQQVSDDGTFRRLFVDALRGLEPAADANGDGYITGTELGQFLFDKVTNLSNKGQTPRYGKLNALGYDRGDFVLERRPANVAPPTPVTAPPPSAPAALSEAYAAWEQIKGTSSAAVLEAFIAQFPGTVYAAQARERLDELRAAVRTTAAQTNAPAKLANAAPTPSPTAPATPTDPALSVKPGSGQSFKDTLADGKACPMCPEMVVVPAGSFTMGSPANEEGHLSFEEPQHKVTIAKPFAVGRFAVTFAEWDACVADGGCKTKPSDQGWGREKRPVINVNWDDAKAFVAWLSKKTGKPYRLLSEAERQYVTRAGTTTAFWWGNSISTTQANYDGNYTYGSSAKGEYRQKTLPVNSFEPNSWGLYQVHGNVWEWTEDCWHDSYNSAPTDGSAWTTGCTDAGQRVVRGGSWYSLPDYLRSAYPNRNSSDDRYFYLGFRVARSLTP